MHSGDEFRIERARQSQARDGVRRLDMPKPERLDTLVGVASGFSNPLIVQETTAETVAGEFGSVVLGNAASQETTRIFRLIGGRWVGQGSYAPACPPWTTGATITGTTSWPGFLQTLSFDAVPAESHDLTFSTTGLFIGRSLQPSSGSGPLETNHVTAQSNLIPVSVGSAGFPTTDFPPSAAWSMMVLLSCSSNGFHLFHAFGPHDSFQAPVDLGSSIASIRCYGPAYLTGDSPNFEVDRLIFHFFSGAPLREYVGVMAHTTITLS